ncbi:uncharacterized protein BJ171DRAFT_203975 [Polychytrium aggregatum]|uniref:uncharacterized protein n=1 Tax=Polychytrium aggregatum TaxID=110093 RepID=UPI0022FE7D9C|nr:uncharacterized protein BJ171DRAFT_203975 [Polychytrium aggregatum]KAI9199544.1 hypothetical protein BJ171DRAFT_203975 [Polychytrium aggregatum]
MHVFGLYPLWCRTQARPQSAVDPAPEEPCIPHLLLFRSWPTATVAATACDGSSPPCRLRTSFFFLLLRCDIRYRAGQAAGRPHPSLARPRSTASSPAFCVCLALPRPSSRRICPTSVWAVPLPLSLQDLISNWPFHPAGLPSIPRPRFAIDPFLGSKCRWP